MAKPTPAKKVVKASFWPNSPISYFAFALAIIAGYLIWELSLDFTQTTEPWDSESSYFGWALIISGFVSGLIGGQPYWRWYVGIYIGQVLFMLGHSLSDQGVGASLAPIGIIFLVAYTAPSLIGSIPGAWLNQKIRSLLT